MLRRPASGWVSGDSSGRLGRSAPGTAPCHCCDMARHVGDPLVAGASGERPGCRGQRHPYRRHRDEQRRNCRQHASACRLRRPVRLRRSRPGHPSIRPETHDVPTVRSGTATSGRSDIASGSAGFSAESFALVQAGSHLRVCCPALRCTAFQGHKRCGVRSHPWTVAERFRPATQRRLVSCLFPDRRECSGRARLASLLDQVIGVAAGLHHRRLDCLTKTVTRRFEVGDGSALDRRDRRSNTNGENVARSNKSDPHHYVTEFRPRRIPARSARLRPHRLPET